MAQWFVQSAEDVLGPFGPSDVLDMVRRGTIRRETKLRKDDSAWFPAEQIGGLFEAAAKPTIRFRCPECGGEIKQPPCRCPQCEQLIHRARREVIENHIGVASADGHPDSGQATRMQEWLRRLKGGRG